MMSYLKLCGSSITNGVLFMAKLFSGSCGVFDMDIPSASGHCHGLLEATIGATSFPMAQNTFLIIASSSHPVLQTFVRSVCHTPRLARLPSLFEAGYMQRSHVTESFQCWLQGEKSS